MWKKIASIAALISSSALVSSCQTAAYKPIICDPGYEATTGGRCAKVPRIIKKPTPTRPTAARTKTTDDTPSWAQPITTPSERIVPPRVSQNVYGLPD